MRGDLKFIKDNYYGLPPLDVHNPGRHIYFYEQQVAVWMGIRRDQLARLRLHDPDKCPKAYDSEKLEYADDPRTLHRHTVTRKVYSEYECNKWYANSPHAKHIPMAIGELSEYLRWRYEMKKKGEERQEKERVIFQLRLTPEQRKRQEELANKPKPFKAIEWYRHKEKIVDRFNQLPANSLTQHLQDKDHWSYTGVKPEMIKYFYSYWIAKKENVQKANQEWEKIRTGYINGLRFKIRDFMAEYKDQKANLEAKLRQIEESKNSYQLDIDEAIQKLTDMENPFEIKNAPN